MKTRALALLLAAVLLLALLTACGDTGSTATDESTAETSAEEASAEETSTESTDSAATTAAASDPDSRKAANEITVGIAQDLDDSLDPHLAVAAGTKEVMFNVFEGLVKPNSDGDLIPAVAESYTVSDDGTVYTFTLRDGVLFHNGEAVTADDVVYSISRCADTTDGEPLVAAFSVITDIEKIDEKTVAITISDPNPEFISYMTTAILPADYDGQDTFPIGTGPFKFVSRTAQDSIVLEKFDEYWGTPASLDRVTYKIIEDADSLLLSLQSGALDIVSHLEAAQTEQLGDEFNILEGTMNLVQALYLNNAVEPFDNELVRQALCYAINVQEILDLTEDGHGSPLGSSMYPAFSKYFVDDLTDYYTQDIEKAKELLAEAGYPDGFEMTITVPSNYQPHMDTAEVLVEQLKAIGVTATIEPVEWASWLSDVYSDRNYQSTVVGVDASTMTARAMLERFVSTASNNFTNYSNEEYDKLFEQAQACYDDEEQTEIYKQMETILTETAANVYIQDLADLVAIRNTLTGLEFYPIYVMDLSTVSYVD